MPRFESCTRNPFNHAIRLSRVTVDDRGPRGGATLVRPRHASAQSVGRTWLYSNGVMLVGSEIACDVTTVVEPDFVGWFIVALRTGSRAG
jgi:hypothetical protein